MTRVQMVHPETKQSHQGEDFLVDWDGERLYIKHEKSGKEVNLPRNEMSSMPAVKDELKVLAHFFDGRLYYFAVQIGEVYKTAVAWAIQKNGSMLMV